MSNPYKWLSLLRQNISECEVDFLNVIWNQFKKTEYYGR